MNRSDRRKQAQAIERLKVSKVDLTHFRFGMQPSRNTVEKKCYARSLGSCDGPISREHYISESILKHFGKISPEGIPWMAGKPLELAPKAMTVKCLCKVHNEFLSPLDALGEMAFVQFKSYAIDKPQTTLVPGPMLERWLLKCLLGILATKQVVHNQKTYSTDDVDPQFIEVLFNLREFPIGVGLYMWQNRGDQHSVGKILSISPIFISDELIGLQTIFAGFRLILSLVPENRAFKPGTQSMVLYRPKEINKDPYPQKIKFIW